MSDELTDTIRRGERLAFKHASKLVRVYRDKYYNACTFAALEALIIVALALIAFMR